MHFLGISITIWDPHNYLSRPGPFGSLWDLFGTPRTIWDPWDLFGTPWTKYYVIRSKQIINNQFISDEIMKEK